VTGKERCVGITLELRGEPGSGDRRGVSAVEGRGGSKKSANVENGTIDKRYRSCWDGAPGKSLGSLDGWIEEEGSSGDGGQWWVKGGCTGYWWAGCGQQMPNRQSRQGSGART
jgi:hypothetical protein